MFVLVVVFFLSTIACHFILFCCLECFLAYCVLNRLAPRTKSVSERVSHRHSISECHSSPSLSSNHFIPKECIIEETDLDLTDNKTLRQCRDVSDASNGQDESTVSFNDHIDDENDSDEYAYI